MWSKVRNRPGCNVCKQCGHVSDAKDWVFIKETQVSCMRGEDVVEYWCRECAKTLFGQVPPQDAIQSQLQSVKSRMANWTKDVDERVRKLAAMPKELALLHAELEKITAAVNAGADHVENPRENLTPHSYAPMATFQILGAKLARACGVAMLIQDGKVSIVEAIDPSKFGPHVYPYPGGTSDCAYGCGCWMGPSRSGGPVDPFGPCPNHPIR